jgi:hypothetical protein
VIKRNPFDGKRNSLDNDSTSRIFILFQKEGERLMVRGPWRISPTSRSWVWWRSWVMTGKPGFTAYYQQPDALFCWPGSERKQSSLNVVILKNRIA